MSLRIIAGRFKGRLLKTPKSSTTRPTQGMLREAVFNICQQQIENSRFLDLFAGSGAMGFEALSRGAKHITLVEQDKAALNCIRENIASLQVENQTTLLPYPAHRSVTFLAKRSCLFDIVYVDPPYKLSIMPILNSVIPLLNPEAILFLEERYDPQKKIKATLFSEKRNETDNRLEISQKGKDKLANHPHLILKDKRRFGIALLSIYKYS